MLNEVLPLVPVLTWVGMKQWAESALLVLQPFDNFRVMVNY